MGIIFKDNDNDSVATLLISCFDSESCSLGAYLYPLFCLFPPLGFANESNFTKRQFFFTDAGSCLVGFGLRRNFARYTPTITLLFVSYLWKPKGNNYAA
uniref:Uncharacterized protein n=1 Tax=Candidatus Kentrum sp. LFY TaxID=2126342 RepID=A0A450WB30_9GAMM|nr:MAG: hypothetical protein BECKLFY1418C_GA0070996_10075 [Candidatus Kentron sp. LFY]